MTTIPAPLAQAYHDTDYRVRLAAGGYAVIRIGQPLPAALVRWTAARPWGFLTAWNPGSQPQSRAVNHAAQQQLLQQLRRAGAAWRPALGLSHTHTPWNEPSLFIAGLDAASLDRLALTYGQLAWVGPDPAGLATIQVSGAVADASCT